MQITIQTRAGLFIVPESKEPDLIIWLQHNAIKAGQQTVYEQTPNHPSTQHSVRQLLGENATSRI